MGLLDALMGDNTSLSNQELASDMLKDSKFAVTSLAAAITEISNPELRQFFTRQLINSVEFHYRLSDLVTSKEWYHPFETPSQQLSFDVHQAEGIRHQHSQ